ncbi:MAG TPA: hypothetical protein VFL59_00375 [Candidatus Nanopelagicales bacterium]|nr:hypothetical protein [Candidatus Nanopelagicales bacterium]
MRPTRVLAYREHYDCSHGHSLDLWIRPRAPGATIDPLRRCPTCETLFLVTDTAQAGFAHPSQEHPDELCPQCRTPLAQSREYPARPVCRECAAVVATWLDDGPDLPASAASVLRCWMVSPAVVDLRDPVLASARARTTPLEV